MKSCIYFHKYTYFLNHVIRLSKILRLVILRNYMKIEILLYIHGIYENTVLCETKIGIFLVLVFYTMYFVLTNFYLLTLERRCTYFDRHIIRVFIFY